MTSFLKRKKANKRVVDFVLAFLIFKHKMI